MKSNSHINCSHMPKKKYIYIFYNLSPFFALAAIIVELNLESYSTILNKIQFSYKYNYLYMIQIPQKI